MDAIVLAGGEGVRLRPLTPQVPKALVPLAGYPLLGLLLHRLECSGVSRVVLAMTRGESSAGVVRAIEADPTLGGCLGPSLELHVAYEDEPLGSGGAIANAFRSLAGSSGTVLVCNGDIVSDLDVPAMLAAHRAHEAALSIAVVRVEDTSRFGVVDLETDGRIRDFVEKPSGEDAPSCLANAGFWLFEPEVIRTLGATRFHRVEEELFPTMAREGGAIFAVPHDGYWRDIGTPEAYRECALDVLGPGLRALLPAGRASRPTSTFAIPMTVEGDSWLGSDVRVEAGAKVVHSAVGDRVVLGPGASVRDSVLWNDVTIGAGARVERSVLAAGAVVPPGQAVVGAVLGAGEIAGTQPSPGRER